MKFKGIKNACSETRCCAKNGMNGATEIAVNLKTREIIATWRADVNSFSSWHDSDIVNVFKTQYPLTMQEIQTMLDAEISEIMYDME